jgi:ATP-dependent Lon protease
MNEPQPPPPTGPAILVEPTEKPAGPEPAAIQVREQLPETMFVFPLRKAVAFPNLMMPVLLDTPRSREIVAKAESHNGHMLLLALKDPTQEAPPPDGFHEVGVIARILKVLKLPDGNSSAMCQGLRRGKVEKFLRTRPFAVVRARALSDIPASGKRAQALFRRLQRSLKRVADVAQDYGEEFSTAVLNIEEPDQLADFTGSYFLKKQQQRQALLEAVDVNQRLELALEFVLAELEVAELGARIQEEIKAKVEKAQKDYFLREQLKIIRRELGEETDARAAEIERLGKAIEQSGLPEAARQRAEEEIARLRTTPAESAEYGVIRNYLEWLTSLPWSASTPDNDDLDRAARVLDEDHYGLEEVKSRILEFLAVRKLRPQHGGSILCLSGPPGVGKTSLGRSIARAMNRRFWRFSLGGMRDEAEIKGHRRTYIGALPGRILQGLKACASNNPVIMLDELDKLGADFRGDPASALLEVLDPEQNQAFLDHYLDVPFDLSRVMFIATANVLPQIPPALRDRMEVIEIPGYLVDEKVQIARRHLIPRQLERHGLTRAQVSFDLRALRRIVHLYTREAGVRALEKSIVRILRKAAHAVATGKRPPGRVSDEELVALLGQPRYADEGERKVRLPGIAQGLAWTPHGGDVMFIEVAGMPGRGALTLTGSLGSVMSESCRIALTCLKARAEDYKLDRKTLERQDFHVHFPAGAIPKDGPSAGITIAVAMVSLVTGKLCPLDLAMTGELTLLGEVLPIGGVREKVLAAQRERLKRVILPRENKPDVDELKPELKAGLEFVYVDRFDQVLKVAFPRTRRRSRCRPARARRGPSGPRAAPTACARASGGERGVALAPRLRE